MGRQGAATLHGAPVVPVLPVQTLPAGVPPQRRANELRALFLQNAQNTFTWSVRSTAVFVTVPESSTKAIGSAPRLLAGGGGQSWLVGYSPPSGLFPGVQASPSLGPALHLLLVGSQIGHDWMNVRQVPLGQSAFVMQPRLAF